MNKTIRILIALTAFTGVLAIGMNGKVWASKLNIGVQAPLAGASNQGMPAGARAPGTVPVVNPIIPVTGGQQVTVGSCATAFIATAPSGIVYTASVAAENQLVKPLPGTLTSCGVQIEAKPGTDLGADIQVCFPVPTTASGLAYYYDGTNWIKTTLPVSNGQSCVTVPASASNPAYAGLFGG